LCLTKKKEKGSSVLQGSNAVTHYLQSDKFLPCLRDIKKVESMVMMSYPHVQEWLRLNQLTPNVKKCKFIVLKSH